MDIRKIEYFVAIVENDFNITQAAEKLYISQSTLSKGINSLETENDLILFERSKGRLQSLTSVGIKLYIKGKTLLQNYNSLVEDVMNESNEIKGDINIGIAPAIISHLFSTALPKFVRNDPKINLHSVEEGPVSLKQKFMDNQVHMATILSPIGLDNDKFEQVKLNSSYLAVFLDANNPLVNKSYQFRIEIKITHIKIN